MRELLQELLGGDRRSIGKANVMVREVLAAPSRFSEIIDGLTHRDPLIRMRCADVAEKITSRRPEWLRPHKRRLLELAQGSKEHELRWHLAQMLPRLDLDRQERDLIEGILRGYLNDESRIVQTLALQGLANLSAGDPELRRKVLQLIEHLQHSGGAAVQARARKLLKCFKS